MFLGIIIGILLTIGAAYITDTVRKTGGPDGERPMVNWDVVQKLLKALFATIQENWTKLTGRGRGA